MDGERLRKEVRKRRMELFGRPGNGRFAGEGPGTEMEDPWAGINAPRMHKDYRDDFEDPDDFDRYATAGIPDAERRLKRRNG